MTQEVQSLKSQVVPVSFHGHELLTTEKDGKVYVAMKPIVEAIGLDWRSQRQRILRQPVMSEGVVIMTTPSAGGDQETTFLPLDLLNGWLFGVDVNRVKPELKERLLQYQKECYQALADYWGKGIAINTRVTITDEQHAEIRSVVNSIVAQLDKVVHKKAYGQLWGSLTRKFRVRHAEQIPAAHFDEAMEHIKHMGAKLGVNVIDVDPFDMALEELRNAVQAKSFSFAEVKECPDLMKLSSPSRAVFHKLLSVMEVLPNAIDYISNLERRVVKQDAVLNRISQAVNQ